MKTQFEQFEENLQKLLAELSLEISKEEFIQELAKSLKQFEGSVKNEGSYIC